MLVWNGLKLSLMLCNIASIYYQNWQSMWAAIFIVLNVRILIASVTQKEPCYTCSLWYGIIPTPSPGMTTRKATDS